MSVLKLYSTGCARNSRTIPYELDTPVLVMEDIDLLMDWGFNERIEMDDDTAMSVDFALLDDKWAYYVTIENRVAEGVFAVNFAMCGIKTYMIAGNSTIKGQWNKTPTWIDPDTITPAVSGYKRGETSIPLPGLLPEGWVFVEIRAKVNGHLYGGTTFLEDSVSIGGFVRSSGRSSSDPHFSVEEIAYHLALYKYGVNQVTPYDTYEDFDIEKVENISYSRLCPYEFEYDENVGYPTLKKRWFPNFMFKRKIEDAFVVTGFYETNSNFTSTESTKSCLMLEQCRKTFTPTLPNGTKRGEANNILLHYKGNNKYVHIRSLSGTELVNNIARPKHAVSMYDNDPRGASITANKRMYVYNNDLIEFYKKDGMLSLSPSYGNMGLDLSDDEQKFGVATIFAPNVVGSIDRSQTQIPWYYEVDNTGWYLVLETPMNKIVIPSFKLPYMSDAWKSYQFREMEYDRAELGRSIQYAKDKFWSDVAKGFGNGAVAGGFAGTHSPKFGAQMGIISMAGATAGAYADRQVEIANAQRQQDNKELLMKNALDNYYNTGHGYRTADNNDFMINIAMPIDDMENEVKISGYSCTGNLVASLERGFIQGLPEPSDAIKGTIRNLITSELQMGVWII
jgi:hypothetical protein